MRKVGRLIRSFSQLLLPVIVLLFLAAAGAGTWLVYVLAIPVKSAYLVTPDRYAQLSSRGAQVTDETWQNSDGTEARGWLLRGSPDAPAVVLLHRYGTDRSHLLNLGVKLGETSNFTVLMPDMRGHGLDPLVPQTSFSGCETQDTLSALEFLRRVKVQGGKALVGKKIGIYGVELGAITALAVAARDPGVAAIALESAPNSSDDLLASVVGNRYGFGSFVTAPLAKVGTYIYFANSCYERGLACEFARKISNRQVMLLAGPGAPDFQTSTSNLSSCFPDGTKVQAFTDMTPTGFDLTNTTLDQTDSYDQKVIYFFKESLTKN